MKGRNEPDGMVGHLQELGLDSRRAYLDWCEARGLRVSTHKSARERYREVALARDERIKGALQTARQLSRRPEDVIEAALTGRLTSAQRARPELAAIAACVAQAPAPRRAALALLALAQRHRFLLPERAVGRYKSGAGNSLIGGVFALARLERSWKRPLDAWRPGSHNPQRQFASLARHLLAEWDVPLCLDGAFFHPDPTRPEAARAIGWWQHAARGLSLRTAPGPLALTRKMAHLIHSAAPSSLTPEEALRWGQARGMGMGERQARALLATPLGLHFDDEPFWEGFVRFVASNPLLDPAQIGPLYDYLHWERHTPRGQAERDRLPVGFTLKGRTAGALLARMEAWHTWTNREARVRVSQWEPTGRPGFSVSNDDGYSWLLRELTSAKELIAEGRAMRHCVGTYAPGCARGDISIWSLQALGPTTSGWLRVMTIAVSRHGQITEARGWCNALPSPDGRGSYARLAPDELALLRRSRRIVQRWAARESLVLPGYLAT